MYIKWNDRIYLILYPLLFNNTSGLPLSLEILLPQGNLVVTTRNSQNVARQRPANSPNNVRELLVAQKLLLPGTITLLCPDDDSSILWGGRNVWLGQNRRRPGNITNPVLVALKLALDDIRVWFSVKFPNLDEVVAATTDKSLGLLALAGNVSLHKRARNSGWGPRRRVNASGMCSKNNRRGLALVLELNNGNSAIGRGAKQKRAVLLGCPRDGIHRCLVNAVLGNVGPATVLLSPDDNLAVVRGRGKNDAKLGVGPGNLPDGAFVTGGKLETCSAEVLLMLLTLWESLLTFGFRHQFQRSW